MTKPKKYVSTIDKKKADLIKAKSVQYDVVDDVSDQLSFQLSY